LTREVTKELLDSIGCSEELRKEILAFLDDISALNRHAGKAWSVIQLAVFATIIKKVYDEGYEWARETVGDWYEPEPPDYP